MCGHVICFVFKEFRNIDYYRCPAFINNMEEKTGTALDLAHFSDIKDTPV